MNITDISGSKKPTLLIAMDSAESSLIEQWTSNGRLPTLKSLKDKGIYGRLSSTARWYSGSVWPTFYTGTLPSVHNIYHSLEWNPIRMKVEPPNPNWLPARPFWRRPEFRNLKTIALDIPMTYETESINGLEISGLVTNDRLSENSFYPKALAKWVKSKLGNPPIILEPHGNINAKSLIGLKRKLLESIEYMERLALTILDSEKSDLFIMSFSATHTAGHKLWDLSSLTNGITDVQRHDLSDSLYEIYSACDKAIANILKKFGVDCNVIVFSLHGMGSNNSKSPILDIMVSRVLDSYERIDVTKNLLNKLRLAIPNDYRHYIKSRLPFGLQGELTNFWRKHDYTKSPVINMVMDLQGYLNINLHGRERDGIIEPGRQFDELCKKIIDGLYSFKDTGTGIHIVGNIVHSKEVFPTDREWYYLPDLVINWTDLDDNMDFMAVSEKYGTIEWPTPGYSPDGRSGNHRFEGFVIANIANSTRFSNNINGHIMDLAPTVYQLMGIPIPSDIKGKPLF